MNYGSVSLSSYTMTKDRPVKLLNRLDELDITRKSLAEAVGVSERTVYHWLGYEKEPRLTLSQVARLCDLLMWSAQELAESYYPPDSGGALATEPGGAYSPK